jgi:hypothetical protein
LELGLRWRYSLILFGVFSKDAVAIYAAATGIWLVNLLVPALAGSLFIIGVRVFRERKGSYLYDSRPGQDPKTH